MIALAVILGGMAAACCAAYISGRCDGRDAERRRREVGTRLLDLRSRHIDGRRL